MDLTFDAAFSTEGLIGHLAYVFLVASMLMQRMLWLRVFAFAAFATGIVYSVFVLHDPVGTFWESLLALVSLIQLIRIRVENWRARFLPHETVFVTACFPGFSKAVQRQLLDLGEWQQVPSGATLAQEGVPIPDLAYLADGAATVSVAGRQLATRGPGALIGELTVATGEGATGTVVMDRPALVWRAPALAVRQAMATRPQLAAAFQAAFFRAVSAKLGSIPTECRVVQ